MTEASSIYNMGKRFLKETNTMAKNNINTHTIPKMENPISRIVLISPLPSWFPTRTVAAEDKPEAIIYEIEAKLMAIWWAASASTPIHPIIIAAELNAPASKINWNPEGMPILSILDRSEEHT